MNRKEAIEIIKNSNIYGARMNGKNLIIEAINELVKDITLADLLGWEEGVEYEWRSEKYKICDDILQCYDKNDDCWYDSVEEINDYLRIQQAKKVESKPKAYHVKDEYSYKCLMKELEEQGYKWNSSTEPTDSSYWDIYENNTVIYCRENKRLIYSSLDYFNAFRKNSYNLIEYKKEEPKLKSRNGGTYIYFDEDTGIDGFEKRYSLIDEFEIIECHKEEPRFYAKIKGWENLGTGIVYFYKASNEKIYLATKFYARNTGVYTKTEWNELGVNDTNADFEKVED